MQVSLLATKLYFPRSRRSLVARPRLVERLQQALDGPLTLVSAPAGYGKTTLLSEWRSGPGKDVPVGWLGLDEADNEPRRFLLYLVAALNAISPELAPLTASQLETTLPPPQEILLEGMINELSNFRRDFVLVLDDWHTITALPVLDILTFLIYNLPPQMHLAILSRADPPLPLARLRAGKFLAEIRAEHLRFTHQEASDYLKQVMGLDLKPENVLELESRCEGWIAGLQMAALSIQSRSEDQRSEFIADFTGSHHYIVDYLAEEVLSYHKEPLRTFLLETSILERMRGELCDALTGRTGSQAMLEELEHANLFLVPLDECQCWYRYHHLFHDFLRKSLQQQVPRERWIELHRRASRWHEENGMLEEAVQFALAARDFDYAANLIDQVVQKATGRENVSLLLNWLKALPPEMVSSHPILCVHFAGALANGGYLDEVEPMVQRLEKALQEAEQISSPEANRLFDQEARDPIIAQVSGGISVRARFQIVINRLRISIVRFHDLEKAEALCRRTLAMVPDGDVIDRAATALYLGHVQLLQGKTQVAVNTLTEAASESRRVNHAALYASCINYLGQGLLLQGRLREAMKVFQDTVRYMSGQPESILAGIDLVRLGDLQREWNDLGAASANIRQGLRLAEKGGDFVFRRDGYIALSQLDRALGDLASAELHLNYAIEAAHQTEVSQGIAPIWSMLARVWLAQGNLQAARQWALTTRLEDTESFLEEYTLITLARLSIAQGRSVEALGLLEHLLPGVEAAGRTGRVIEILLLQALAFHAQGNSSLALDSLSRSLSLAEPEGYVRLFLDEGTPLVRLLVMLARQRPGNVRDYINLLLSAAGPQIEIEPAPVRPYKPVPMPLVESLSDRELEVLRLIADGSSNQDVARRLFIAIGTVKRHTVNIFGKLGVTNRTQAVSRGRELHLLE